MKTILYIRRCPHCKKLAPTWQKLAEEYQFFADVKILQVSKIFPLMANVISDFDH